nr:MAG TPA: hypothetical protein [Caudoviricetes sp.]
MAEAAERVIEMNERNALERVRFRFIFFEKIS